MVDEGDIIRFLKEHGEVTLEEVSENLKIPKYGPNSAYAVLYSLKSKNIVERRGNRWALVARGEKQADACGQTFVTTKITEKAAETSAKDFEEKIKTKLTAETLTQSQKSKETREVSVLRTQTILDKLFLGFNGESLGGIPISSQLIIVGPLGSGKSLLTSEVAIKVAHSGHKVLLVVLDDVWRSESRTLDLQYRMMLRSKSLELSWEKISENLIVINPRDLSGEFLGEYEAEVSQQAVDLAIVDPINIFWSYTGGDGANRILMNIINLNRTWGTTGIFVAHLDPKSEVTSSSPIFGQVMYLMDGVIEVTPVEAVISGSNVSIAKSRQLRAIRVLGCRLCGSEDRYLLFSITRGGLTREIEL